MCPHPHPGKEFRGDNVKKSLLIAVLVCLSSMYVFISGEYVRGENVPSGEIPKPFKVLFDHQVAYTAGDAIDGVEVADFDPEHPGLEIISVDRTLKVTESYFLNGSWFSQTIWQSQGQMLTPAVGDLIPSHPGNEIIVVGISSGTEDEPAGGGITTLIYKEGNSWRTETIFQEEYLIHGATVGDLIPSHPGEEAVVTSFSGGVYLLWYDNGSWNSTRIYLDSGKARKAVIDDFIPEKEGNEVAIVAKSGNLSVIYREEDDWKNSSSWNFTIAAHDPDWGFARIATGDADSIPGKEIYGATDGGTVYHVWYENGEWQSERIYQDTDSLRGVWVGDVDPSLPGPEVYSFGYSTRLVEIWKEEGQWKNREIFRDSARGHEIRISDAVEDIPGPEIYIVGYSRNVTCLANWYTQTALAVNISFEVMNVGTEEAHLRVHLTGGPLPVKVRLSVEVSLAGTTASLSRYYVDLPGSVDIHLSYPLSTTSRETTVEVIAGVIGSTATFSGSQSITIPAGEQPDTTSPQVEGPPYVDEKAGEILITFSENISESSVAAAVEEGRIYIEGEDGRYHFNWEVSGRTLKIYSIRMGDKEGFKSGDDITLHVEGVKDMSGNEMSPYQHIIKIREQRPEEEGKEAYLILIAAILVVAVVLTAAVITMKRRGEKEEEEGGVEE